MTRTQLAVGVVALLVVAAGFLYTELADDNRVVEAGFWFEDAPFVLPPVARAIAGDLELSAAEVSVVEESARAALRDAYAGLRIRFDDSADALYRVGVSPSFTMTRGRRRFAAGESVSLGALGGQGLVSFEVLASYAAHHVPPDADREALLRAIGRGIGRTAAHEFAHQLLRNAALHAARGARSYETPIANRKAQFEGPMEWEFAWPLLEERLGRG